MASPAATPVESAASAPEALGLIALIRSDYRVYAEFRQPSRWMALPRMLLDPSLHAAVLIRLSNASPWWGHWFWRNLLIWKHSIDCGHRSRIGPRLYLPHPFVITIAPGVVIGSGLRLYQNVTLGGNLGSSDAPSIGNDVQLLPNCSVVGSATIGDGAVIGNGALVDRDVPAGGVAYSERATVGGPPANGETASARAARGERIGHQAK